MHNPRFFAKLLVSALFVPELLMGDLFVHAGESLWPFDRSSLCDKTITVSYEDLMSVAPLHGG